MKRSLKWLTAIAAAGTMIGLIIAFFCKKKGGCGEDGELDFMEDEEFDLDNDLKPVSEREYVPLKKAADASVSEKPGPEEAEPEEDTASEEEEKSVSEDTQE